MIEPRPIEERIARWLQADAPDDVPQRVLDSAFELTRTMTQERARSIVPQADRRLVLLVAAVLLAAALAAAAVLVGSLTRHAAGPEVPFMRGDASRTATELGPGPLGAPIRAWDLPLDTSTTQYPILVDGAVIVGAGSDLVAVDARTGHVRWRATVGGRLDGAPSAADGVVVVADGEEVVGFDVAGGFVRWHLDVASTDQRPAIVDGIAYVGTADGEVVGVDVTSGSPRWSWQGPRGVAVRADVVADGVAYVSTADGRLFAVGVADARSRWEHDAVANWLEPSLVGDTIYVSSVGDARPGRGEVAAIDRTTGGVRWTWRPPSGLQATHGAFRDGVLYVATEGDGVVALTDTGDVANVVWSAPDVERTDLPPVLSGNVLYVFTRESGLVAMSPADGRRLWSTDGVYGSNGPLVWNGLVITTVGTPAHLQALAEPTLVARLSIVPSSATPPPSPSAAGSIPPNPLRIVRVFDPTVTGVDVGSRTGGPEGTEARFGRDGRLYAIDLNDVVSVLDPATGQPETVWGGNGSAMGQFSGEHDLAVGADGRVVIADGGNHRVQIFDGAGHLIRVIGAYGSEPGEFVDPSGVDVAPDGSIYVLDGLAHTISKFDAGGTFTWRVGGAGNADVQLRTDIADVAVLDDARVLVTFGPGGPGKILDPATGAVIARWGPEDIGWDAEPVVDRDGRVWMFEYAPSRIDVFDPSGGRLGTIAYEGRDAGFPSLYPAPIVGPNGHAYSFEATLGLVEMAVDLPTR